MDFLQLRLRPGIADAVDPPSRLPVPAKKLLTGSPHAHNVVRGLVATCAQRWWRFLCGTTPTPSAARAAAISLGLLVCDPGRLPLPVLVRAASRPTADMYLPEALLQEIVRLGERALCPQQARWPYRVHSGEISFNPAYWSDSEMKGLLWLEDELSGCLLDLYEKHRPGTLERRAMNLLWQARKVA